MKVGDKLICKKSYSNEYGCLLYVNKHYEIIVIDDDEYHFLDEDNDIYDKLIFSIIDINIHFYLPDELRLKKLESL